MILHYNKKEKKSNIYSVLREGSDLPTQSWRGEG